MNKVKRATALKYEEGYEVPVVTAQGIGRIAEKIIEKANETNVPIVYNKELAQLLNSVDIGDSIPEEIYTAVAEILAYVMEVDGKAKGR